MTDFTRVQLEVVRRAKVSDLGQLVDVLTELGLTHSAQEQLWVIALDSVNNIRSVTPVAVGTYHDSFVSIPTVLSPVLLSACDRFIVAHNHPSGRTRPSADDIDLTARIESAAESCELWFDDHIIVEPGGTWTSLASLGHVTRRAA